MVSILFKLFNINSLGSPAKISVKEKVDKFGLMAQCTKAGGETIKQMEKED